MENNDILLRIKRLADSGMVNEYFDTMEEATEKKESQFMQAFISIMLQAEKANSYANYSKFQHRYRVVLRKLLKNFAIVLMDSNIQVSLFDLTELVIKLGGTYEVDDFEDVRQGLTTVILDKRHIVPHRYFVSSKLYLLELFQEGYDVAIKNFALRSCNFLITESVKNEDDYRKFLRAIFLAAYGSSKNFVKVYKESIFENDTYKELTLKQKTNCIYWIVVAAQNYFNDSGLEEFFDLFANEFSYVLEKHSNLIENDELDETEKHKVNSEIFLTHFILQHLYFGYKKDIGKTFYEKVEQPFAEYVRNNLKNDHTIAKETFEAKKDDLTDTNTDKNDNLSAVLVLNSLLENRNSALGFQLTQQIRNAGIDISLVNLNIDRHTSSPPISAAKEILGKDYIDFVDIHGDTLTIDHYEKAKALLRIVVEKDPDMLIFTGPLPYTSYLALLKASRTNLYWYVNHIYYDLAEVDSKIYLADEATTEVELNGETMPTIPMREPINFKKTDSYSPHMIERIQEIINKSVINNTC